jgi:hypothetical protein
MNPICIRAPQHVRDAAIEAFLAWPWWNGEPPEPTVFCQNSRQMREITLSRACGLVWRCTCAVPDDVIERLRLVGLEIESPTYAACARAVLKDLKSMRCIVY